MIGGIRDGDSCYREMVATPLFPSRAPSRNSCFIIIIMFDYYDQYYYNFCYYCVSAQLRVCVVARLRSCASAQCCASARAARVSLVVSQAAIHVSSELNYQQANGAYI